MRWSFRPVLAALFVVEAGWIVVRQLVYVLEGWPVNALWFVGFVLGPAVLVSAAWFVRRREPPTLLLTAVARPLVLFVAIAWNLSILWSLAAGRFTLI